MVYSWICCDQALTGYLPARVGGGADAARDSAAARVLGVDCDAVFLADGQRVLDSLRDAALLGLEHAHTLQGGTGQFHNCLTMYATCFYIRS